MDLAQQIDLVGAALESVVTDGKTRRQLDAAWAAILAKLPPPPRPPERKGK